MARNKDLAISDSQSSFGVVVRPLFGSHRSEELKVVGDNLILENTLDTAAFMITPNITKSSGMIAPERGQQATTVIYASHDQAEAAMKLVQASANVLKK